MEGVNIPYRCAIYWKVAVSDSLPEVTIYGLTGLIKLNHTATMIWLLSDGRRSERQILRAVAERFPGISNDRLEEEVGQFLSRAESCGLLMRQWDPLQPYRVIGERSLE